MTTFNNIKTPPEERVKANLLEIIKLTRDTLIYVSNKGYKINLDPKLFDIAISFLQGWETIKIVDGFISRSYNYWDVIKSKDEIFLLENAKVLFGEIPTSFIEIFVDMMKAVDKDGKSYVPDETKECVWKLIHAMIKGAVKYIHSSRCPKEIDGKKQYTVEFFPQVSIRKQIEIWEIKL